MLQTPMIVLQAHSLPGLLKCLQPLLRLLLLVLCLALRSHILAVRQHILIILEYMRKTLDSSVSCHRTARLLNAGKPATTGSYCLLSRIAYQLHDLGDTLFDEVPVVRYGAFVEVVLTLAHSRTSPLPVPPPLPPLSLPI
jgi:hypothetical protein